MHEAHTAKTLMIAARNTVAMCIHAAPSYHLPALHAVLTELQLSQLRAGGPAARLAEAIWNAQHRYRHPRDKHLIALEENSYNHLISGHRSRAKAHQYHVWKAIEAYCPLRERAFGQGSFLTPSPPPLGEAVNPVRNALYKLNGWYLHTRKPHLQQMVAKLMLPNPTKWEQEIVAVAIAATAFETWKAKTHESGLYNAFMEANNAAWVHFHKQPFLWNEPLGEAFTLLRNRVDSRSQAYA